MDAPQIRGRRAMSEQDEVRRRTRRRATTAAVDRDEFFYVGLHLAPKVTGTRPSRGDRSEDRADTAAKQRRG